ncbi:hypothetical protein P389DRAFT_169829 [Cystobasidium minutum MCA 4210]|uniref:uncharacterized protein n=1 Tax=Cystobasidium minutum MCA 4210 TaxID=1397322 RepID=UPI0034CF4FB2|eukprot:jgi/Rhomi1/169829/fgenesh1_kg.3_\
MLRHHSSTQAAARAAVPQVSFGDAVRTLLKRSDSIFQDDHHQTNATSTALLDDPYAHDVPCYIPYHQIYARLPAAVGLALLLSWLLFLFSFLGIVASDFFCPNLSTLAARLGLPDDVAGATMVGWANGAPDLFSTFASIKAGSGSLAIGELIGAASFICSVVAGSMVLVKPFKVSKFNFFRDVGFSTLAVAFTLNILRDGRINAWESSCMIALYAMYVVFVATGSYWRRRRWRQREKERLIREAWDDRVPDVEAYRDQLQEGGPDAVEQIDETSTPMPRAEHRHNMSRSRSLTPLVIPFLRVDSEDYFSSPAPISGTQSPREAGSPVPFPTPGGASTASRRRSATVTSGRHTPTTPFPRHSAHSTSHARSASHHMQGRMSLLGALEFRDVVNSLQAESHAGKSLAAFELPRSSASSTTSGDSHRRHRRSRSQRRTGSSSDEDGRLYPGHKRPSPARPNTFHGSRDTSELETSETSRRRAISGPSASPPARDQLSANDFEVDDPWRGASAPAQMSASMPSISVGESAGEVIPDWNARDEERDGASTAGESDVTARPPPPRINVRSPTLPNSGAFEQFPSKALKLLGIGQSNSADSTVPPKAQRVLGLAEEDSSAPPPSSRKLQFRDYFYIMGALAHALFPSLHRFWQKSFLSKVTSIISMPAILLLNLTLPVVDESVTEEDIIEELEKETLEEVYQGDEDGEDSEGESDGSSNISIKDLRQRRHDLEEGQNGRADPDEEQEERDQELRRRIAIVQELHSPAAVHHLPHRQSHSAPQTRENSDPEFAHSHHFASQDGHLAVPGFREASAEPEDAPTRPVHETLHVPALPDLESDMELRVGDAGFTLEEGELTRYLVGIQCFLAPIFAVAALFGDELEIWYMPTAVGVGLLLCTTSLLFFKDQDHITRVLTLCVIGFFIAVVWILTIVNEVVGVLQTIGHIFRLSDAILGLTIFAVGNSLGDLVANVTVARMGYPLMALSACFGGPMLNILLGIGFSGTYMNAVTHQPVHIKMNTTLFVSGISLLAVLLFTLISVPLSGFVMSRKWAYSIIAVYLFVMTANVIVEIKSEKEA